MPFADVWQTITSKLEAGRTIPNWTVAKGLTGDPFIVIEVQAGIVKVELPGTNNFQHIPRKDFEGVAKHWQGYLSGKINRNFFSPRTRYSKYIISILHSIDK